MKRDPKYREHAVYRIVPEKEDGLELRLCDATGRAFAGEISDLDADGVSAFFDRDQAPVLPIGHSTLIRLTSFNLTQPVEVSAVVIAPTEGDQHRRYGFRYQGGLLLRDATPRALVNRRGAFRVMPRPGDQIDVHVSSLDEHPRELAVGRLTDISGTGMGLLSLPESDAALAEWERVEVSFVLPGGRATTTMLAQIVTRALEQRFSRLGPRFDAQRTTDFRILQRHIFRCVVGRQQQDLRGE